MNINHKLIWSEAKDYIFITLGLLLYTFGWTVFLLPYQIVTGGVTGLSAIIFYATGVPIETSYFLINVLLLAVALKVLGLKFMMKTIYAICALSIMLWAAQKLMMGADGHFIQVLGPGQEFMSLVVGCLLTGTSLAVVFLNNGSTGGTDIVAAVVNKFHDYSLGTVLIMIDLGIIGSCLFVPQFGDELHRCHKVVFGLCTMGIECFMLDYVMNARRESVQFLIFSHKHMEIADAITKQTDHTLTILDGHGWYSGKDMKVLCLLARKRESVQIFRLIKQIDPHAFVSQSSVIGVYGEGFDQIKVKVKPSDKALHAAPKDEDTTTRQTQTTDNDDTSCHQ